MPKHIRRKKTTSPARAKPRAAARTVAVAAVAPARPPGPQAKAKPAKKRGRRRGLLSGLGTHEHERDILDQYLHEVSKTPLLTQKEEIALARKVRAGDQESMQELVKRNLRFVISVEEVPEPGPPADRPDRRGERRAAHGGPQVRPRSGRQVHLLC